ncbi:Uncharacterised protein [Mycobacteroides abscessus subsp. abscessus]|nr:Uncharacterised protein [Mycobacteroides abscessus subsp. abscessus]
MTTRLPSNQSHSGTRCCNRSARTVPLGEPTTAGRLRTVLTASRATHPGGMMPSFSHHLKGIPSTSCVRTAEGMTVEMVTPVPTSSSRALRANPVAACLEAT